jgi:hypothetical protein
MNWREGGLFHINLVTVSRCGAHIATRYDDEREGRKLVLYTTTNKAIRQTFDVCSSLLKLFEWMRLKVHRKDVMMDPGLLAELQRRSPGVSVRYSGDTQLGLVPEF